MKGTESIMDIRKICLGSGLALVMAVPALADTPGTITLDVRARYENADQDGRLGSDATTLRTRLGWKSPDWKVCPVMTGIWSLPIISPGSTFYCCNGYLTVRYRF